MISALNIRVAADIVLIIKRNDISMASELCPN
jgi:hypothetical protein